MAGVLAAATAITATACSHGGVPSPTHPTGPSGPPNYHPLAISPEDWPEYRRDDQRSGDNDGQTVITKANVATLAPKWTFSTNGGAFATPVVANGGVYIADLGGYVHALDETTGTQRWSYSAGGVGIVATPTYSGGSLYVADEGGTSPGSFFVLNAATGAVSWVYPPTGQQYGAYESSPIVAEDSVFEGLTSKNETPGTCINADQLIAYDPASAKIQQTLTLTPPGVTGESVWSSPLLDPTGYLYITTGNACTQQSSQYAVSIIKLDPRSFGILWAQHPIPDQHDLDFGATPLFVNGLIIASGKDGNIYALNAASGAIVWKTNGGVASGSIIGSPATDGKHIFVPFAEASIGGAVVALNLDGSLAWSLQTGPDYNNFGVLSAPAVSQGMVFVGYTDVTCHKCFGISALDADSGQVLWRYPTNGPVYSGPSIVNGGLFVAEFERSGFYCFTPNGR